jgi:hypothetical protein
MWCGRRSTVRGSFDICLDRNCGHCTLRVAWFLHKTNPVVSFSGCPALQSLKEWWIVFFGWKQWDAS